jgi:hypothetical protein
MRAGFGRPITYFFWYFSGDNATAGYSAEDLTLNSKAESQKPYLWLADFFKLQVPKILTSIFSSSLLKIIDTIFISVKINLISIGSQAAHQGNASEP